MKSLFLKCLLPVVFLYGCIFPNGNKVKQGADSILAVAPPNIETDTCTFDTSYYKLTTERLLAYQKDIHFTWDEKKGDATALLNDNDSLILHIGGCYIFYWTVNFITDSAAFNNNQYLLDKAAWMAKTFLGNGFGNKFSDCIANRQFTFDSTRTDMKFLTITNTDTSITNKTYEDVTFELSGKRTIISVSGYED